MLYALGEGLQFASVVALTVSFGLGLSATIHFLNRLRLETTPGIDPALAVERATVLVGPALILTTVVLACGLGGDGVFRPAVAAPVRLAQRVCNGRSVGRGPLYPAANGNVPDQSGATAARDGRSREAGGVNEHETRGGVSRPSTS